MALNIGSTDWQRQRIADAYDVARAIGTNFKFFVSYNSTEMLCDVNDIVSCAKVFSDHPNQFKVNGKVFVSSYAGDCLGNAGWASLKAQTNAHIILLIWGLEGQFNSWSSLDSWYWCVVSLFGSALVLMKMLEAGVVRIHRATRTRPYAATD